MILEVQRPALCLGGVGHQPRRLSSKKGCLPDGPKRIRLFRTRPPSPCPRRLRPCRTGFNAEPAGHPVSSSPAMNYKREPRQYPGVAISASSNRSDLTANGRGPISLRGTTWLTSRYWKQGSFPHPPLLHSDRTGAPPQGRHLMTAAYCASALGYRII